MQLKVHSSPERVQMLPMGLLLGFELGTGDTKSGAPAWLRDLLDGDPWWHCRVHSFPSQHLFGFSCPKGRIYPVFPGQTLHCVAQGCLSNGFTIFISLQWDTLNVWRTKFKHASVSGEAMISGNNLLWSSFPTFGSDRHLLMCSSQKLPNLYFSFTLSFLLIFPLYLCLFSDVWSSGFSPPSSLFFPFHSTFCTIFFPLPPLHL